MAVPSIRETMQPSLKYVNRSESITTENRNVNSDDVELRMVLDVTDVAASEALKVSCAKNHSGATCTAARNS